MRAQPVRDPQPGPAQQRVIGQQVARGEGADEPSVGDHHDLVRGLEAAQVVGGHDHAASRVGRLPQEGEDSLLRGAVQAVAGLVGQEHGPVGEQHRAEGEAALLPAGEAVGALRRVVGEVEALEHRAPHVLRGAARGELVLDRVGDELGLGPLEHEARRRALERPGAQRVQPGEGPEQRGLPGAVAADDREQTPGADLEVRAGEHGIIAPTGRIGRAERRVTEMQQHLRARCRGRQGHEGGGSSRFSGSGGLGRP